ncbi:sporulation integral membrane protein YtvI [Sediminibacillus albus]|uniref:Sporulation integral membrane protein YtvI n=1 Tax=Sediminibacillus albus TaxID=407036 RepID=A0A1G9BV73_9BACI|nr:sporulation integral membrane protein YtvI [Sediminibacillus albus]SDK42875.1 sporulation integral membrane protein YtvI [Sediminibacillus albus]
MINAHLSKWFRLIVVLAATATAMISIFYIASYTYPFIIAIIIAMVLNPFVNGLEKKLNMPRALAVIFTMLCFLLLMSGIIVVLIVELINGTAYLADMIPGYYKELIRFFEDFIAYYITPLYEKVLTVVDMLEPSQQTMVYDQLKKIGEEAAITGAFILQRLFQLVTMTLASLPSYLSIWLFSLLGTFFISKDWYKLKKAMFTYLPETITQFAEAVYTGLKNAFFGFLKAQLTLICITFLIVLSGLMILKVNHALTIAVITASVDLLPYLGTGIIFIPWICYLFFSGNYAMTISLAILYAVVIVQRQITEPKLLATTIGIHPLATLVALFAGFQIWGLWGLAAGPVILVLIVTLVKSGVILQLSNYIKG